MQDRGLASLTSLLACQQAAYVGIYIFSQHTTQVTTPFCKKRFEKGIFAEIYYLFASERLLVYLLHILLHIYIFVFS